MTIPNKMPLLGMSLAVTMLAAGCFDSTGSSPVDAAVPGEAIDASPPDPPGETIIMDDGTRELLSDGAHLYWLDHGTQDELNNYQPGAIKRIPLTGGPQQTIASELQRPNQLVQDDAHLYWVEGSEVWRASKEAPHAPTLLADVQAGVTTLAANDARVYFRDSTLPALIQYVDKSEWNRDQIDTGLEHPKSDIAATGEYLYWMHHREPVDDDAGLYRVAADGSAGPELIAPPVDVVGSLEVHGDALYLAGNNDPDLITAIPLEGGSGVNLVLVEDESIVGFDVSGQGVVAAIGSTSDPDAPYRIVLAPLQPGTSTVLAEGVGRIEDVIIEGDTFYWVTGDGTIYRSDLAP